MIIFSFAALLNLITHLFSSMMTQRVFFNNAMELSNNSNIIMTKSRQWLDYKAYLKLHQPLFRILEQFIKSKTDCFINDLSINILIISRTYYEYNY